MIFWWTSSMLEWHAAQVFAMFFRAIEERGSVCGRVKCGVWHETHVAETVRPFFRRPSPWIDSV